MQATHLALNQLGNTPPAFGLVIASYHVDPQQVLQGVVSLTGTMPLAGFSTPVGLTADGLHPHAVVVMLLASPALHADVQWLPGYAQPGNLGVTQLVEQIARNPRQPVLLFGDGFSADIEPFCQLLPPGSLAAGALAGGDLYGGNAYQISGSQFGTGGLSIARLEGNIRMGVGYAHGWQPVGTHLRVTRSRGHWLHTLDGRPACEVYAQIFGYPAREWAFPPLNHLVRLYPLGLEGADKRMLVRTPLRVEADGSFRMNASLVEGEEASLLVGSMSACRLAACQAVEQALVGLEGARPVLALVFADTAWQMLHEAHPGTDVQAVREMLGGIPIAGAYTLGQIVPGGGEEAPRFLNQHMAVVLLGESL